MRILVVGGGGREHALVWRLAQSPLVDELIAAPGNAGIGAAARPMPVAADDVAGIVELATNERPDLVVVGPEAPLVAGVADELEAAGIPAFGPSAVAARIEGSKAFAKDLMVRSGIPTARAQAFTDSDAALRFVDELGGRAVVKADGLAAGKGVTVATDRAVARRALAESLDARAFGDAGATVLVEELLEGPEISAFALCDGPTVVPLTLAQDFKRIGDGDTGPNTGGMGAYSDLPWLDDATRDAIWEGIVRPTARAMADENSPFRGVLFAGLMLTDEGPKVLEFNCRFGDPETEAILPRFRGDLAEALHACATGHLDDVKVDWSDEAAVTVVIASGGYPGSYETGLPIEGLERAAEVDGALVLHSGTEERQGRVVTAGGRVLAVTGVGATIADARSRAYDACGRLSFDGMQYRRDIAAHAAGEESR